MDQQTVHLFVLDTMADWEPGYAIAGINQPTFQARPGRYTVRTVGPTRDPVRTMGGLTIVPDLSLEELTPEESAMLILPGAVAWDEGEHAAAVEKARAFLDAGVPVAAICGATAGLARHGLLDGRPHTSNAPEYLAMAPGYAGQAHYVGEPSVRDGDLITASGTAPVHFARLIFERLEVYAPEVLDAWYALYTTGDASAFYALQLGAESA
ncbi:MAG: glutamine amidotransferase [Gemmatimonadetes bacterium]|nr:glutamine amidotransferase [Gemmatimonadota bacterium]